MATKPKKEITPNAPNPQPDKIKKNWLDFSTKWAQIIATIISIIALLFTLRSSNQNLLLAEKIADRDSINNAIKMELEKPVFGLKNESIEGNIRDNEKYYFIKFSIYNKGARAANLDSLKCYVIHKNLHQTGFKIFNQASFETLPGDSLSFNTPDVPVNDFDSLQYLSIYVYFTDIIENQNKISKLYFYLRKIQVNNYDLMTISADTKSVIDDLILKANKYGKPFYKNMVFEYKDTL